MVHLDILREILQRPDADSYDLLAHVAFGADLHSCEERANALFNLHKEFFESFDEEARAVLLGLMEKYRYGGDRGGRQPGRFRPQPLQQRRAPGGAGLRRHGRAARRHRRTDQRLIYMEEAA